MEGKFIHSVFFWLNNPGSAEDRKNFRASLQRFIDNSEYIKSVHIGTPAGTPREVVDNSWTYNLIVEFDSKEDHDKYQEEDVHKVFVAESHELWARVQVYDSIVDEVE